MEKDKSRRFYHPELDCLRYVAFLSVFIFHFDHQFHSVVRQGSSLEWLYLCITKSGIFGVDLFFCLSSFLITMLLLREYSERGSIDVRAFWTRRILRIWPLYYAFLMLSTTVFSYWLLQPQLTGMSLLRYWFFLGNWDCMLYGFHPSAAGPLWSISVEEQFYLVWPLLLVLVKPRRILPLAVALLVIANLLRFLHPEMSFTRQWANTLYHVDPIVWGVIGAWFARANLLNFSLVLRSVLFLTGVSVIPAYFFCHGFDSFFDGKDIALFPISALCSILIIVSLYDIKAPSWSNVLIKVWAYLGRISYGLYVFHLFALYWIMLQLRSHGLYQGEVVAMFPLVKLEAFAAMLLLTILLAWVSYQFLESPFLRIKSRFTYIQSSPPGEINNAVNDSCFKRSVSDTPSAS